MLRNMQRHFLCNISYVVSTELSRTETTSLKQTLNMHNTCTPILMLVTESHYRAGLLSQ